MEPTLHDGSVVLVDKLGPRLGGVHPEDVVVFASPQDGRDAIKRVVAVGGQQVAIRDAELYVDGTLVREPQVDLSRIDGLWFGPVTVPERTVFVLGDARAGRSTRASTAPCHWIRSSAGSRWSGDVEQLVVRHLAPGRRRRVVAFSSRAGSAPGNVHSSERGRRCVLGSDDVVASPTRILIADDHRTFAELFALGLEREPDLEAVGHARTAAEALQMADSLRPDLVIMDVRLGDGDGIEVTAQLTQRYEDLRVIVLTGHPDPVVVSRAAKAGACGFLPKDGALDAMLHALRSARRGSLVLPPEMVGLMAQAASAPAATTAAVPSLTASELQVLELLGQGLNPRTIAHRTGLSVDECRTLLRSVMTKLGATSQLEAVVSANRYGLISLGAD